MGCSCNNLVELNNELDYDKEIHKNKDFFIDYGDDNIISKYSENNEDNILNKINTNSVNSNINDIPIYSTYSYANNYNNLPIFGNNTNKISKEFIIDKDKDKEMIIEDEKENENNNELNTEGNYRKYKDLNIILDQEKQKQKEEEQNKAKTQIKLIPKKMVLNNNKIYNNNFNSNNNNINKESIGSVKSNISKRELIYSCSSEIIVKKKYENENITEEEYKLKPNDNYSQIIFDYINKLRRNPKYIANFIEENKKFIVIGENNEIYFNKNNVKFVLNKGSPVFDETIDILNNLEPMNKLVFNKNITVDLPEEEEYINNLDYLKYQIGEIQKNGNHISSFWKEKIKDPEMAFIMMIVDDNYMKKGTKRKDLINPDIKYIGISSVTIGNNFACYITLSNRKKE